MRRIALRRAAPFGAALITILIFAVGARPACAQELRGVVLLASRGSPAPGVILVAERPADGSTLTRVLTGDRGQFLLRLPPGEVRLRALRIGHRPTVLGTYTLAQGERRALTLELPDAPIVLSTVITRAESRCQLAAQAGELVVTLFQEARKALLSTRLLSSDGPPTARLAIVEALTDLRGRPLGRPSRVLRSGASVRPFQSLPPGLLSRVGYMTQERNATVYRAPDADVLLSDAFAAEHCLQPVDGQGERAGWIGLAFRPTARDTRIVRIRGTIWLDRSTFELQLLEYAYVGVPRSHERAGIGGNVVFTQLADGHWFESAYEIRMPRLRQRHPGDVTPPGETAEPFVLDAILRTSGEVISLARGARVSYVGNTALADSITAESAAGARLATGVLTLDSTRAESDCPMTSGSGEPVAMLHGTVFDAPPQRAARAEVRAEWKEQFRQAAPHDWRWQNRQLSVAADDAGTFVLCGAPRDRLVSLSASLGSRRSRSVAVRVPWSAAAARVDLILDAERP